MPYRKISEPKFRSVRRDGTLAKNLVENALYRLPKPYRQDDLSESKIQALIALGIALHSYADIWSHQNFSGYWNSDHNDITDLQIKNAHGDFENVNLLSYFLSYAMMDLGHAEAGNLPDRPDVVWQCNPAKRDDDGKSNCTEFLRASKSILDLLLSHTENTSTWSNIEQKIKSCFQCPSKKEDFTDDLYKNTKWSQVFDGIKFIYDDKDWFRKAIEPKKGFLDLIEAYSGLRPEKYDVLDGKEYFYFHKAAKMQRDFVPNKLIAALSSTS